MRFFYDIEDAFNRRESIFNGEEPEPIKLYPYTGCMALDYFYNPDSVWWPVHKYGESSTDFGEFEDVEEAEIEFYTCEADRIYCYIHDC